MKNIAVALRRTSVLGATIFIMLFSSPAVSSVVQRYDFSPEGLTHSLISQDGQWIVAHLGERLEVFNGGGSFKPYAVIKERVDLDQIAFSRSGKTLFMVFRNQIMAWDMATRKIRARYDFPAPSLQTITGTANENLVFVGGDKGRVALVDVQTGRIVRYYEGMAGNGAVEQIQLSHDGSSLIASGRVWSDLSWVGNRSVEKSGGAYLVVWETETAKVLSSHDQGVRGVMPARTVAIGNDGRFYAVAYRSAGSYKQSDTVKLYQAQGGELVMQYPMRSEDITRLSFSPNYELLYALGDKSFEAKDLRSKFTVEWHEAFNSGCFDISTISHNAQFLLTCTGEPGGKNHVLYWHPIRTLLEQYFAFVSLGEVTPDMAKAFIQRYPNGPIANILRGHFGFDRNR